MLSVRLNSDLTLEGPSTSIDASKFLHAKKLRFLKYYRFVLFDFYFFILVDTLRVLVDTIGRYTQILSECLFLVFQGFSFGYT